MMFLKLALSGEETLPPLFVGKIKQIYRDFEDTISILTFNATKLTVLRPVWQ